MLHQDFANRCQEHQKINNSLVNDFRPSPALCQVTITYLSLMDRDTARHQSHATRLTKFSWLFQK